MNQTHDRFKLVLDGEEYNLPTVADCTRAVEEGRRGRDNAARTESELAMSRLITRLREAERKAGGLKGPAKVEAMREADKAAAELYRVIREVKS